MERREFVKWACGAGLAAGTLGLGACARTHRYTVEKLPKGEGSDGFLTHEKDLKLDMATLFYTKTGPVLLVRTAEGVKGYQSVCPHTMCELNDGEREQPLKDGEIRCFIHDSYFKIEDGGYISGPAIPGSKLPEFRIKQVDGKIYRADS